MLVIVVYASRIITSPCYTTFFLLISNSNINWGHECCSFFFSLNNILLFKMKQQRVNHLPMRKLLRLLFWGIIFGKHLTLTGCITGLCPAQKLAGRFCCWRGWGPFWCWQSSWAPQIWQCPFFFWVTRNKRPSHLDVYTTEIGNPPRHGQEQNNQSGQREQGYKRIICLRSIFPNCLGKL